MWSKRQVSLYYGTTERNIIILHRKQIYCKDLVRLIYLSTPKGLQFIQAVILMLVVHFRLLMCVYMLSLVCVVVLMCSFWLDNQLRIQRESRGGSLERAPIPASHFETERERPNYFIFMGYLRLDQISKANPHVLIHMNPIFRNPGSAPENHLAAEEEALVQLQSIAVLLSCEVLCRVWPFRAVPCVSCRICWSYALAFSVIDA